MGTPARHDNAWLINCACPHSASRTVKTFCMCATLVQCSVDTPSHLQSACRGAR